jgi:hypothetical protein
MPENVTERLPFAANEWHAWPRKESYLMEFFVFACKKAR